MLAEMFDVIVSGHDDLIEGLDSIALDELFTESIK